VGRSSKIRENNKNSRKYSSLHPKIQTATRRGVIKENLEQQQKHKGHHSRRKIDPKKSQKKVGRSSKIRENNKKNQ